MVWNFVAQALLPNAAYFSPHQTPALVVGRTPWSAAGPLAGLSRVTSTCLSVKSGSRGARADLGVCPQLLRHSRYWEKYAALGTLACSVPTHRDAGRDERQPIPLGTSLVAETVGQTIVLCR